MAINLIDHYAVRTVDLEPTRDFYVKVLGFAEGDRPAFPFPGKWLYQGGKPIVHLIGITGNNEDAYADYTGEKHLTAETGCGAVDHIAFAATGLADMKKNLKTREINFYETVVPGMNLHQVFVKDPNGVLIELNYPADEKA